MRRIGRHALQLGIHDEIHSLERKDAHQAFVPQYSGLGQSSFQPLPDNGGNVEFSPRRVAVLQVLLAPNRSLAVFL